MSFEQVFARIAEGAVQRESDRTLPHEPLQWLREAGFGKVRVPREYGGQGASLPELTELLIRLGRADSNLPQLLRGHLGFVESRLAHPDPQVRDRWLRRIAAGVIVGNAQSERSSASWWAPETTLQNGRLNGRKYYSTGTLFADWIHTTAADEAGGIVNVFVPAAAPGVTRLDDWDGFGQRLTGSGTTIFEDVPVAPQDVEPAANASLAAFFQLVHLATLAGIGRAAVAETVAFVNGRARNLFNPDLPAAADPQVQAVVGRIAGASFAADAATLAAARALEAHGDDPDAADAAVFAAQGAVARLVLGLTTELFEVGGASATAGRRGLDRHWRNARTVASHNPIVYRDRIVGQYRLDGTSPSSAYPRPRLEEAA
ncbi:acyl-CoA dehydrogenase family protein [Dactylosporangium sp. CA-139066]|uniref:acyl-CoA dehydrogenase family protein n=1 Tax=Dactylosporangium sp. CA-139066 TaxID=3239930 RepID=UPI003D8B763B